MAMKMSRIGLPLLLLASCFLFIATVAEETTSAAATDAHTELEQLRQWKTYLTGEVDKWKAESQRMQAAWQAEHQRATTLTAEVEQLKKTSADAEARAAAAEVKVAEAEAKVASAATKAKEAEALASSQMSYSTGLQAEVEQLKKSVQALTDKLVEAETRASELSKAASAANGDAEVLRQALKEKTTQLEAQDARIEQLASATSKAGGLRGHALAIYDILLEEAARHRDTALNYANDKLPGFKAKVTEVHAVVTSKLPQVTGHVEQFVRGVDGELRPFLRKTLGQVPALKPYIEDPVVLQGVVAAIICAPLLALLPMVSICFRLCSRRSRAPASGRGSGSKSSKRRKHA